MALARRRAKVLAHRSKEDEIVGKDSLAQMDWRLLQKIFRILTKCEFKVIPEVRKSPYQKNSYSEQMEKTDYNIRFSNVSKKHFLHLLAFALDYNIRNYKLSNLLTDDDESRNIDTFYPEKLEEKFPEDREKSFKEVIEKANQEITLMLEIARALLEDEPQNTEIVRL